MNNTLNKVTLIGYLGDDVKLHYFEKDNCIGRISLATNETYTNKNNEKTTQTEWHYLVVRNKVAELFEKYLSKGDRIYVEGKIKTRTWQTDEGITKSIIEIHVNEFTFLNTKKTIDKNNE